MAAPMLALSVAGGTLGAIGQLQAGDAAKRAADVEAAGQERAATLSLAAGFDKGRMVRKAGGRIAGQQVAGYSASGVDASSGSSLLVRLHSAAETELDAMKEEFSGLESDYTLRQQAALTRYGGRMAKKQATYSAVGSILGAGAQGMLFNSMTQPNTSNAVAVKGSRRLYGVN